MTSSYIGYVLSGVPLENSVFTGESPAQLKRTERARDEACILAHRDETVRLFNNTGEAGVCLSKLATVLYDPGTEECLNPVALVTLRRACSEHEALVTSHANEYFIFTHVSSE